MRIADKFSGDADNAGSRPHFEAHLYTQITQLGRLRSQSHNLLSASWRTGKAGGVIQKGLGVRERGGEVAGVSPIV